MPCGVPPVVDILRVGSCRSMTRPPVAGDGRLGQPQRLAEAAVEALGDVAGELEVLALVVAHRNPVGVVEQDVGRLQHRVGEEVELTDSRPSLLSLNCVIRESSPNVATAPSSHAPSVWAGTWLCTNRVQRSGSRPAASSVAAVSSVFSASVSRS